ncbi:class I mannose-6-phosphate isomerase [Vallitalea guaymasensis]|nr:class I mannose-6-phosphate isomerase [Vallitalea guaymasensis]
MYKSNYDKRPVVQVKGYEDEIFTGYEEISQEILRKISTDGKSKTVVTIECYPGVNKEEVLTAFIKKLNPELLIDADDYSFDGNTITNMIQRELTDDRVFGVLSCRTMDEFFDETLVDKARQKIERIKTGVVLVYGTGASIIDTGDILVYADLARWEIQLRYRRKEIANWKMDNYDEDLLKKYKRGFFVEWRVADRLKKKLYKDVDYILDTNKSNSPKMITKKAFTAGLEETVNGPFRVVPYFDKGVWGGQWMKEVCDLDKSSENFAWCFDCVPEENSLYLKYGDTIVETPSINVVFFYPHQLLGEKVHSRFGTEFPIRVDMLDTMGGQNLSLQVHPLTEYIQEKFGMHYTQDESYYMLDAKENANVYLGVQKNVDKEALINDLKEAEKGNITFPDEKYVNKFGAKKHDHFLIPAGTIHCSGNDCMVLEISATPYIFTFKLWDWERLGLDGKPRPVHINHGEQVIQWDRDTDWVKNNLINRVEPVDEGNGWRQERTGLHEREFIETRRYWFSEKVSLNTEGGVNVLNLVEGREAIVESPENRFQPFVVHYAETFIVPASVGAYTIKPYGESEGKELGIMKIYVR